MKWHGNGSEKDQEGQGVIEWALIVVLVMVIVIAVLVLLGPGLFNYLGLQSQKIDEAPIKARNWLCEASATPNIAPGEKVPAINIRMRSVDEQGRDALKSDIVRFTLQGGIPRGFNEEQIILFRFADPHAPVFWGGNIYKTFDLMLRVESWPGSDPPVSCWLAHTG